MIQHLRIGLSCSELLPRSPPAFGMWWSVQSCEKGDGVTSQVLLFQLGCSDLEENSFFPLLPSPSHIAFVSVQTETWINFGHSERMAGSSK